MTFLSASIEELAARRRRLQAYFKPFIGGVIEFAVFGGLVLGVAAVFLGRWYGVLPLAAFLIGHLALEQRRQSALAAGAAEEAVRPRYDRLAFALTIALAVLGVWVFAGALHAKDVAGWTPPPSKTINLDLVTQ